MQPNSLLVGLINTLPPEKRARIFGLKSVQQQITALQESLPSDLIASGFRPQVFGLSTDRLTSQQGLELLESALDNERFLKQTLVFRQLSSSGVPLSTSSIDHLNTNTLTPENEALLDQPGLDVKDRAKLKEQLQNLYARESRSWRPAQDTSRAVLTLEEQPADLATLRGSIGGDCATSKTPYYVFSPNERTFYIYGPQGEAKGYVQGTVLRSGGKSSFYLHTIAGSNISKQDARLAISMLADRAQALDVDQIVLPSADRITRNINYAPIREVYLDLIRGLPVSPLEYTDKAYRTILDRYVPSIEGKKANYDQAEVNVEGHVINAGEASKGRPQGLIVRAYARNDFIPGANKVTEGAALRAAAILSQAQNDDAAKLSQFILEKAGLKKKYSKFMQILKNSEGLPLKSYYEKLRAFSSFDYIDRLRKEDPILFAEGQMHAADAFSPAHRTETLRLIRDSTLAEGSTYNLLRDFFDPKLMDPTTAIQEAISYLRSGKTHEESFGMDVINALAYNKDLHISRNSEVLAALHVALDRGRVDDKFVQLFFLGYPSREHWQKNVSFFEYAMDQISNRGLQDDALESIAKLGFNPPRKLDFLRRILDRKLVDKWVLLCLADDKTIPLEIKGPLIDLILARNDSADIDRALVFYGLKNDSAIIDRYSEFLLDRGHVDQDLLMARDSGRGFRNVWNPLYPSALSETPHRRNWLLRLIRANRIVDGRSNLPEDKGKITKAELDQMLENPKFFKDDPILQKICGSAELSLECLTQGLKIHSPLEICITEHLFIH